MDSNRRKFMRSVGASGVLGVSLTAGCISGVINSGPVKKTKTIVVTADEQFDPKNAHVEMDKKAELTIENNDDVEHRVVSPAENLFLDKTISPQKASLVAITKEGVFDVFLDWDKENVNPEDFDGERMKLSVGSGEIKSPIE